MRRSPVVLMFALGLAGCTMTAPAWYNLTDEAPDTTGTTDMPGSDAAADTTAASADDTSTTAAVSTGDGEAGQDVSSDASTGTGPEPVCGNGVLEEFGLVPEECDDGNLDPIDGCDDACNADRTMFVTSFLYEGGDIRSLDSADALCAQAASDVGMPSWLKFRAWLSDSKTHARDRFKFSRGRIILVNGLVVADSWTALLAGQLQNPVWVTERSETYQGGVWTGTDPQGVGVVGATHCDDWTSSSVDKVAHHGYSDRPTSEWTLSATDDNPSPCSSNYAIYCLEER